jgi:hypothetical protein
LDADIAESEAFVEEIVVVVVAARDFLARFEVTFVVLAEAVSQRRFLAGEQRDASAGAAVRLGEFKRHSIFFDHGAIEMLEWNAFTCSLGLGSLAQDVRQIFAVFAKVFAQDVALEQKAADAASMIEQPRFAAKAQAIKTRENEQHQRAKTG